MNPLSMPLSNRLVNTFDGNIILEADKSTVEVESKANPQVDLKGTVGRTREGEDKKINSGLQNTNPPKE